PPAGETSRLDLRTYDAVLRLLDELDGFGAYGGELTAEEVFAALERAEVRLAGSGEVGRVAVLDLLRARTRRFEVVFLLGLEEGSLPRRSRVSAVRSRRSRGRSTQRRPTASGSARWPSSRRAMPTPRVRSPTRTTGSAG